MKMESAEVNELVDEKVRLLKIELLIKFLLEKQWIATTL